MKMTMPYHALCFPSSYPTISLLWFYRRINLQKWVWGIIQRHAQLQSISFRLRWCAVCADPPSSCAHSLPFILMTAWCSLFSMPCEMERPPDSLPCAGYMWHRHTGLWLALHLRQLASHSAAVSKAPSWRIWTPQQRTRSPPLRGMTGPLVTGHDSRILALPSRARPDPSTGEVPAAAVIRSCEMGRHIHHIHKG